MFEKAQGTLEKLEEFIQMYNEGVERHVPKVIFKIFKN